MFCPDCSLDKPESEFYARPNGSIRKECCKKCRHKRNSDWARNNRIKFREAQRKYRISRYNISIYEYNELLDYQDNKCAICGGESTGNLVVDHSHTTGEVRGLLCHKCNLMISCESPDTLRKGAEYLETH